MLTPDQQRVKELLCETITLLCKNGLHFQTEFCIDALIGITLDQQDVFLVSIKETVRHGEVFVRDRHHAIRLQQQQQAAEADDCHSSTESSRSAAAVISEPGFPSADGPSSDPVLRLQPDSVSRGTEKELIGGTSSGTCTGANIPITVDEDIAVKAEKSNETVGRDVLNPKQQISSSNIISENCSVHPWPVHSSNMPATVEEEEDKDKNSTDRHEEEMISYNENNSIANFREEGEGAKQSSDASLQLSTDSSVHSLYSLTETLKQKELQPDSYYSGDHEEMMLPAAAAAAENDSCHQPGSTKQPDAEGSDSDELVVVKVEPPCSDYNEDRFSSASSYRLPSSHVSEGQNFVSDTTNYMYSQLKAMSSNYPIKHSQPTFDYAGHQVESSAHGSAYNQFSQAFNQLNRYQMKLAMSQGPLPNEPSSLSPHLPGTVAGIDRKQSKSLIPGLSKPYRQTDDHNKGLAAAVSAADVGAAGAFVMQSSSSELNCSMSESESTMQTDLDKYAEMQRFCMNRRARSTFTAFQLQRLESAFRCAHYVDAATRSKLAEELNLSDSIILVWFQNRRQKFKKQMKMNFS